MSEFSRIISRNYYFQPVAQSFIYAKETDVTQRENYQHQKHFVIYFSRNKSLKDNGATSKITSNKHVKKKNNNFLKN